MEQAQREQDSVFQAGVRSVLNTALEAALGHVRLGQGAGGRRVCCFTREAVGVSTGSASWAWLQLCPALALKAWGNVFSFLLLLVFFL